MVICLERGADLHMAQRIPLPLTVSCFSKIQSSFTFLVPAHLGSPRQRAIKRVCVCVAFYSSECYHVKVKSGRCDWFVSCWITFDQHCPSHTSGWFPMHCLWDMMMSDKLCRTTSVTFHTQLSPTSTGIPRSVFLVNWLVFRRLIRKW